MVNIKRILFLIVICLLLVACEESYQQNLSSEYAKDIIDKCKCREYCYGERIYDYCLIENANSPKDCESFVGLLLSAGIYGGSDTYFDESYLDKCYRDLISRQNDVVLCSDFPDDYSYMCFNSVGKKTLQPRHCKELPYNYKADCYLHISKNDITFSLNLCDELNEEDRITCYSNKATINNDSSICLELEEEIDKINCYSQMDEKFDSKFERKYYVPIYYDWFTKAKFDKDLLNEDYCVFENNIDIVDSDRRNDSCYMSLAMYKEELSLCYNLPREYAGIDMIRKCLFYTALWNDFEIEDCDEFGIDFKECKEGVILSKRNPELCKDTYDSIAKQRECISKIASDYYGAYNKKDITLCSEIIGDEYKNNCIREIFNNNEDFYIKSSDENICKVLFDSSEFYDQGRECYYNIAIERLDISFCEYVLGDWGEDCKERVQKALEVS